MLGSCFGCSVAHAPPQVRQRFVEAGGVVLERTPLSGLRVHPNGVALDVPQQDAQGVQLTARLVLDCMGHASPAVQQLRWGHKPDGVCLVVGTCASGFEDNSTCRSRFM